MMQKKVRLSAQHFCFAIVEKNMNKYPRVYPEIV
jgi:hypothetical protein